MPMLFQSGAKKKQRALELLDLVGLSHKKHSRLTQLSGGEQQRIAVAIALANNPRLLLADEPTGSVDAKTGAYILDVFRKINQEMNVTTVIVTHDTLLTKKVNRVVAIRDGKISSERIMKQSYLNRLQDIHSFTQTDEVQDEYAVLDRAGRLQIPREMLDKLQVSGNRLKIELEDQKIIIEKPDEAKSEPEVNK
jgi:ABC-type methionine transport system ATPase subunit